MKKEISDFVEKALYHVDVRKFGGLIRIPPDILYYCITGYTVHLFNELPGNIDGICPIPGDEAGQKAGRLAFGEMVGDGENKKFEYFPQPDYLV